MTGAESGRKEIYVPPGQGVLTTVIHSTDRPVTADVFPAYDDDGGLLVALTPKRG